MQASGQPDLCVAGQMPVGAANRGGEDVNLHIWAHLRPAADRAGGASKQPVCAGPGGAAYFGVSSSVLPTRRSSST
jgi:hypothetical protein